VAQTRPQPGYVLTSNHTANKEKEATVLVNRFEARSFLDYAHGEICKADYVLYLF
jgi:hypothetical protein